MSGPCRQLTVLVALGLIIGVQLPERAEARVTVADRELVSQRRVSRTAYLFTYRLTINNVGTSLDDVKVYVSCDAPGTTLVDDIVEFGDIPENQATTSTDTFSLRQDRRIPFDPECLIYEVGFNTIVRLSGTVTDTVLADATLTGTVTRPNSGRPILDSGRPIIEEYSTVTDADGNYELELEAVTEDDFITLEAEGTGDQEGAVLTSSVGSVGTLTEQGTSGSIVVDSGDNGALNVTHITTAQDELVRRLNGGVLPTTDAELAALQSQIDGAELLTLASVIKTVIDNPNIVLPPGVNTTVELIQLQNQAVFDAFLEDLETNFPNELAAATQETAEGLNIGFSPAEVPGTLYASTRNPLPFANGGFVFDFGVNGDGSVILGNGSSDIAWLVNSDGEIEVDLLNPPVSEFFVTLAPFGQVRAQNTVDSLRIVRLTNGLTTDQVFILRTIVTTYPDDPIPDEVSVETPSPDAVYGAFGAGGILPITAEDVAGDQIAMYYYHENNESVGLNDPPVGADFLTFNEDGTGSTARRGFGFGWSAAADGTLGVDFDNGDSNQYVIFSEDGDVARTLVIGTIASSGLTRVRSNEAISYDGVSEFSEPNLLNRRYRGLFAILDPEFLDVFDFLFLPGGTGCRQSPGAQRLTWESTPEALMDSFLFSSFDPTVPFQRRTWQAIDIEPGLLGDRYWVIETLDISNFDPNFVFADPTVTPGRINSYEFIEDLTGQFDPCGLGTSTSLTTLFGSNNGGVGNMFDVATSASDIQVTGLDVNVDFAVGTQFTLSVFTVSGSFEDTITAPAGCTFNCAFDASAWTLVATGTGTAQGRDVASFVDIDDIVLDANTTTGFWVTLARDGSIVDEMRYTNIAGPGDESDANITILVGAGVTGQVGAEGVARNRAWNGTIYYDTR